MANSVNNGEKMGNYTPLAAGEKNYFLGDGNGSVVAVGKTESGGATTNRLVKLSDIAGDKLPTNGTNGQFLQTNGTTASWADVSEVPSPGINEHRGHVLTVDNSDEVVWAESSGGGGESAVEVITFSTGRSGDNFNASMSVSQAVQKITAGKMLIAKYVIIDNNAIVCVRDTYPLSFYYYSDEDNTNYIYFNYGLGSSSDADGIIGKESEGWDGPWKTDSVIGKESEGWDGPWNN